jgi:hypothetical protein
MLLIQRTNLCETKARAAQSAEDRESVLEREEGEVLQAPVTSMDAAVQFFR